VRTWAPKGQTPTIQFHFNWNHVSVIAGLTRTNFLFRLHEGSIKKEDFVIFFRVGPAWPARDPNDLVLGFGYAPVGAAQSQALKALALKSIDGLRK